MDPRLDFGNFPLFNSFFPLSQIPADYYPQLNAPPSYAKVVASLPPTTSPQSPSPSSIRALPPYWRPTAPPPPYRRRFLSPAGSPLATLECPQWPPPLGGGVANGVFYNNSNSVSLPHPYRLELGGRQYTGFSSERPSDYTYSSPDSGDVRFHSSPIQQVPTRAVLEEPNIMFLISQLLAALLRSNINLPLFIQSISSFFQNPQVYSRNQFPYLGYNPQNQVFYPESNFHFQ